MSEHPDAALCRRIMEGSGDGDTRPSEAVVADDGVWSQIGTPGVPTRKEALLGCPGVGSMMRRRVLATVLGFALLASCAGPSADVAETTEPPAVTSSTQTVTSMSTTASTTSSLVPATSAPATSLTTVPGGPTGSGCSPGDSANLPEGEWFGFVLATSATGIEFDLACWFTGQAAIDASAEDGEESPPPNDYYVRNQNRQTRSLAVSSETQVTWYPNGDPTSETEVSFEEWADAVVGRGFMFGLWLDVIDGEVVEIREQWVP